MTAETDLYRTALRRSLIVLAALAVVGAGVGAAVDGAMGAIAALIGVGVAAVGAIPTQLAMLRGQTTSPQVLAGMILFSFLGKMLIVIVALVILRGIDDFNRPIFAIATVLSLVATLVIEFLALRRARISYVDPGT